MKRMRAIHAVGAALALAVGCGGATFEQGVFDNGTVRYRIGMPGGAFERVEVSDNDLAFFHERFGSIAVNSTCEDYEDVPKRALLNHLLFGTREREYRVEETVTIDGRGALHAIVDLQLDGVPMTLEVFLLKKDGCVYDMTRIASREAFEPGRPYFLEFVSGFEVLATRLD